MQRRARTFATSAALAVALAGGLTACSSGGDGDGGGTDAEPGGSTATAAQAPPGRYQTLPEPCGTLETDQLEKLLPGAGTATGTGNGTEESPYEGEPTVTYDTDRRVGCSWQSATSLGSRSLTLDFERVVSYDAEVSDDEEAERLFAERAREAGVDAAAESPDPESAGPPGEAPTAEGGEDGDGTRRPGDGPGNGAGDGSGGSREAAEDGASAAEGPGETTLPEAPSDEPSLPPRTLDGIGDAAFLDDTLVTGDNGGRATQRDVTLVFRTSNVLVTVEYSQSVADEYRTPDSAELQEKAQQVAGQLAGQFDD
ncbi:hypothetical protein [Streptomyces sp. JJ36]|uniref:hypothetical protein n=1 Tax=Streptomyces sp. JJ36 TaxID=2736645 RepID=UPI001F28DBDE|nr:hypothetical protein [Streptomyces sp. JJ36]MCF6524725.1 hypothetical protein [Streptomyces sp. JJ36]